MLKRSVYTQVVLDLVGRMEAAEQAADEAQPTPVMQEWLEPHELKKRLGAMSEGGRRAFRESVGGIDEAMRRLQPGTFGQRG